MLVIKNGDEIDVDVDEDFVSDATGGKTFSNAMDLDFKTTEEDIKINGDAEVAGQFTALPFDHIIFTGSTQIGKKVMRAASEHLTPVTLELGGKSPTIIAEDFPLDLAAERITQGKMLNAGQACIAPDYLFVKADQQQAMIDALRRAMEAAYPNYAENPDLTWVVNDRHYSRLKAHIEDARVFGWAHSKTRRSMEK